VIIFVKIDNFIIGENKMNNEALLKLYLERLAPMARELLEEDKRLTALEALKKAIIFLEGEMKGY